MSILRFRRLLRLDAVASIWTGVIATLASAVIADMLDAATSSVLAVGVVLLVFGVDLLVVSRAREDWLRPAAITVGAARELVFAALLIVGIRGGLTASDLLIGALLVESVVLGVIEMREAPWPTRRPDRAALRSAA